MSLSSIIKPMATARKNDHLRDPWKQDLLDWVYWLIEHFGIDIEIAIHGISMGAASALALCDQVPSQVRFIVEDCGYTNAFQQLQDTIQLAKLPKLTALFSQKISHFIQDARSRNLILSVMLNTQKFLYWLFMVKKIPLSLFLWLKKFPTLVLANKQHCL